MDDEPAVRLLGEEHVPWVGAAPPPSEARHTAAVVDDKASDFDELYRTRYVAMVRLAALLVDRRDIAEEITQDAFAVVFQRWDGLDSPGGYLRLEVVNRCRDALRRRRLDRRHTPHPRIERDEPDEMGDAIRRLSARQQIAVVLRFYEDLTVDQIAEAMGARPGTVKSWLNRAMARLREEIPR